MERILIYALESSLILALLYLVYYFLARRDNLFGTHRFFLLTALAGSALLPLLRISLPFPGEFQVVDVFTLDAITIRPEQQSALSGAGRLGLWDIFGIAYLLGVVAFSLLTMTRFMKLYLVLSKNSDGTNRASWDAEVPFSFFNYIYIPEGRYTPEELAKVRAHEETHARQWHSLDVILLELLLPLFWFNPVFWLVRKELRDVHEYLADRSVIELGHDSRRYQQLLFEESTGMQMSTLSNNFNRTSIKNRMIMMTKTKPNKAKLFKYFIIMPVSAMMAIFISFNFQQTVNAQTESAVPPPPPPKEVKDARAVGVETPATPLPDGQDEIKIFKVVEKMPEYPGGIDAMRKYMVENIKYPDEAKKKGISGTVYVTFLVTKTGELNDVKILRGVAPMLDEEALRVVRLMPKWKPGTQDGEPVNVVFNLPVKFSLDEKKDEE